MKESVSDIFKQRHGCLFITDKQNINDLKQIFNDHIDTSKVTTIVLPKNDEYNSNIESQFKTVDDAYNKDNTWVNTFRECSKNNTPSYFAFFNCNYNSVESLNTLLDDNKVVLIGEERIKLESNMRVILVDKDANNLSPATVSRCGTFNDF